MQRRLVCVQHDDGFVSRALLLGEQRNLRAGKSWNVITASSEFFPNLREFGRTGICANIYIFDGAMFGALMRHLRAKHKRYHMSSADGDVPPDSAFVASTDWVIGLHCRLHVASLSICHALGQWSDSKDEAHLSIKSLINGSTCLHSHVDHFFAGSSCISS